MSDDDVTKMLTDPTFAASVGAPDAPSDFNFNADGSMVGSAQTTDQKNGIVEKYTLNSLQKVVDYDDVPGEPDDVYYVTPAAADFNKAYFEKTIKTITSVDQLMADDRLTSYIKAAYSLGKHGYGSGLVDGLDNTGLRQVLVNGGLATQLGLKDLHDAFNFNADGTVTSPDGAQSTANTAQVSKQYMARYDDEAKDFIDDITSNYKKLITSSVGTGTFSDIKDINDFLRDNKQIDFDKKNDDLPDLYHVALQAYGLTEADLPKSMARKVLTSDAYDPKGYVASLKDDRITNFARAFNFGADGKIGPSLAPLSDASMAKYATNYKSHATMYMADGPLKDKASKDATTDVDNFAKGMADVKSLDDFLGNSKLTDFILKSVGLDPKDYDKDTLKKIFTSDPEDKKSYLNTKADSKFKDIVADFNFDKDGNMTRSKLGTVQDAGALDRTQSAYVAQQLETQQGQSNDGTRLALYFARQAPNITSLYTILGDKALFQVVQTAFSLPTQMSSMDVDKQVSMLQKFIDLKDLGDPTKVDKLVKRFTAMYDIQNSTTQAPALQILTNGGTTKAAGILG